MRSAWGDATESFGATRIAQMHLEARRRVGRPGMPVMNQTPCGVEAIGMIGAARLLSPRDGYYVAPVSELRLDPDRLVKAAFLQDWNANIGLLFAPIVGGMAGGPETAAVVNVAYWFLGALTCKCNYFVSFPLHMMGVNNTHRDGMWSIHLATEALKDKMNLTSAHIPAEDDEFEFVGLTATPSTLVKPPRVAESPAHLECIHYQTLSLPATDPELPNDLVLGRVVGVHIDDSVLKDGLVDIGKIHPLARLGYRDYTIVDNVLTMLTPD